MSSSPRAALVVPPNTVLSTASVSNFSASIVAAALLALGLCSSCGKSSSPEGGRTESPSSAPHSGTGPETGTPTPDTQSSDPPSPEALAPIVREEAEEGVAPRAVAIELAQPLLPALPPGLPPERAEVGAKTVLAIEPPTPGVITQRSRSTLVFTPRDGFAPATEYTVRVTSIETERGVVALTPEQAPARVFRTPAFALVRIDFKSFEPKKDRLETELVFSAPVDVSSVEKAASFSLDGAPIGRVSFERTERKNVVRANLFDRRLAYGVTVLYTGRAGVRPAGGGGDTAPASRGQVRIHDGQPISILASHIEEGATGFYVTVVCSDAAAGKPGETFWHWDTVAQESYQVSRRCVLEESDARESIHFSPPVKFSISATRGGFRILGDFSRGTYSMRIDANARSMDGGVLKAPYTATYSVPARRPQLAFVAQGRYLPKSAWDTLALRHMNVSQAEVTVRHVPVDNLVFWATADMEAPDGRTSDIIARKKLPFSGAPDRLSTSFIDVKDIVKNPPAGLLELSVRAEGTEARARVLVTDLNLVAKQEGGRSGGIHVWALGMHDNKPIPGVTVKAVVPSGRAAATCSTDRLGGCFLKTSPESGAPLDPATPFALVASREGDVTYLEFEDVKTPIADALVQGRPFSSAAPYRAGLYGDRGVYRPGETVRVVAILRDEKDSAPPEGMPVNVELVDARQKVARKLVKKTNVAGVIAMDFKLDDFAPTGPYRVRLEVGKKPIGDLAFNVEEFVPERMKAEAKAEKADLAASEPANVDVSARYLFGGSAAGSKVELVCQLSPTEFSPKNNAQYAYGIWRPAEKPPQPIALGTVAGELGAEGTARVSCPTTRERHGFLGASRLIARAAVFEAGSGRTTQTETSAIVHPEAFYIGLTSGTRKVKANEAFTVEGIVVDWTGRPIPEARTIELELLRVESENDWTYDEDQGTWEHRRYTRLASDGVLPSATVQNGKFSVTVTAGSDAQAFVVRARSGRAQTELTLEGSSPYWWWGEEGERDQTPRPMRPASVDLDVPPAVAVGEKTKIAFEAPFAGRALVAVETDRVLVSEWLDVLPGKVEWTFSLPEFAPNVYVSAFVVKDPHLDSKESFLPSRAFGVTSVRVLPKAFDQAPKLTAPAEVRSSSKLEVELELGASEETTFATVAAVDEGILSLTRFVSPDPLALLFERRALGVTSSETIGWNLLLPAGGPSKSSGGDGDGGLGRVQPVKPVALWSGLLEVPKSGKLKVAFDVPQYRGSLRVMAVTAAKRRMGSAVASVTVRDPIVVQATLPRFLTLGDRVEVPVFVSNVSGKPAEVAVSLAAERLPVFGVPEGKSGDGAARPAGLTEDDDAGLIEDDDKSAPIALEGPATKTLSLADGASQTVLFRVKSLASVGAAKIRVRAVAGAVTTEESLDVPFAPAAPRTRTVQRVELSAGRNDVTKYLRGWLPTTERSTLWVSSNPYGDTFDHLRWLLHYPYGCLEQTTSSTRPLLYLSSLIQRVDPERVGRDSVEAMVMSGVNRILSMQTATGGFGYWPGGETVPWASAYATHLLLDAKKLRFPVPEERLDDALDWLEQTLTHHIENESASRAYVYGRSHEPYMQLVLALAGRGRKARIERLIEEVRARSNRDSEAREELYMLQAALYLSGDHRYEAELKRPDISPIQGERRNSWSFYSDRRRRGFTLALFTDLFGSDPAGDALAQLVAESLRGHASSWYTTQELVWAITGLGKRLGETARDFAPPTLIVDGKKIAPEPGRAPGTGPASSDRSWTLARASERRELTIDLPDTKGGKVWLILGSEGVREDARYVVGGNGLSLQRSYRAANGEPLSMQGGTLELGSVVYVVLEIKNQTGERIQNVALVDRFPASFEIENPRLGRGGATLPWLDAEKTWAVEAMDLRDDRLQVFGAIESGGEKVFVYALRAVSAGQFTVPPAEAEAMYYPDHWAREPGGRVTVRGPWGEEK